MVDMVFAEGSLDGVSAADKTALSLGLFPRPDAFFGGRRLVLVSVQLKRV